MYTLAALRLNGLALFSIVQYRQFDEPHWYGSLFALAVGKSMPLKAQDHWLGDTTFLGYSASEGWTKGQANTDELEQSAYICYS